MHRIIYTFILMIVVIAALFIVEFGFGMEVGIENILDNWREND